MFIYIYIHKYYKIPENRGGILIAILMYILYFNQIKANWEYLEYF